MESPGNGNGEKNLSQKNRETMNPETMDNMDPNCHCLWISFFSDTYTSPILGLSDKIQDSQLKVIPDKK